MIKSTHVILNEYKEYSRPDCKLSNMVKEGKYYPIVKGLYETDPDTPGYFLAASIYGPSYLSFEFALAYYGLIPERVYTCTSATFEKKKTKKYETNFGSFLYQDIPSLAYPHNIRIVEENGYYYTIATKEKALCDLLYILKPVANQEELYYLLFEDLRIEEEDFKQLNFNSIFEMEKFYHSTNIKILCQMIRRKKYGFNN